ncbi:folate-binding protein YgfZ [Nocardioides sp. HDW12B]|uniref:CAF17-like 4Fe-4S cluster assembly/insertion protein YgfZ n=1 Tax=Nocardioides sp. HDW12B TaxID=2714939 RepID=UPI00140C75CA|nr:folate-binding protein YgfZ [Nocardioides sp. HDW12B]QIK64946.1 folate-binding protein YgfZ [Nocardioides sp. HDW12B]
MPSPLLTLPGAVAAEGVDAEVAAHYGSFNVEQRTLAAGDGFVDLSHRGVFRVTGPDRLTYLHAMTTQHLERLQPGVPTEALVLSPQGHVEHHFRGVDDGETFTGHVEPGRVAALVEFLDRMRFMMRVEVTDATADLAVAWRPSLVEQVAQQPSSRPGSPVVEQVAQQPSSRPGEGPGKYDLIPRDQLEKYAAAAGPACGLWAFEALRIARGEPRFGVDTDHRTIPNEMGWVGPAVHLDKGCYRGQETVARVHTLGRPPRRLVLLHLDGSENALPRPGETVTLPGPGGAPGKPVGFVGSSARHHELGPIALGLVKRNVSVESQLDIAGMPAAQEVLVDPEVGLHVRPRLG